MIVIILIPVGVILGLIGAVMALIWNRTSLKEQLHAEQAETSRVREQHMNTRNALKAAEQKSAQFYTGLQYAIATADKAIDAARLVEVHGAEMRRFFGMVLGPELETGRHAVPAPPLIPPPLPSRVRAQLPVFEPAPPPAPSADFERGEDPEPDRPAPPVYEHPYPENHPGYHHRSGPYVAGAVSVSNPDADYVNEREQ